MNLIYLMSAIIQMVHSVKLTDNMYSRSKKKRTTPFNTNYRREMKLVPIMDNFLL